MFIINAHQASKGTVSCFQICNLATSACKRAWAALAAEESDHGHGPVAEEADEEEEEGDKADDGDEVDAADASTHWQRGSANTSARRSSTGTDKSAASITVSCVWA